MNLHPLVSAEPEALLASQAGESCSLTLLAQDLNLWVTTLLGGVLYQNPACQMFMLQCGHSSSRTAAVN